MPLENAKLDAQIQIFTKYFGLTCQHTHQRFNRQQRRRVMTQINPCLHDGIDLVDCGRWLVVCSIGINLIF